MEVNKNKEKDFDAVKMMREIREKVRSETEGMTFQQLRDYIDAKLANRKRLVGQK